MADARLLALLAAALALGGLSGGCAGSDAIDADAGAHPGRTGGLSLPPGAGREILERECLRCHELDALTLFSDYYGLAQWRALIVTMRANGAELDNAQVDVLAQYLAEHFGTGGS